ncbi:MAG: hypothetical protein J6W79_03040 [Alphaproteobacteria bacterium]|nr:hypothetical protein [Alphaproteobacteria bacterium]
MDNKTQHITHGKIAHRVPKTDTCIYGIEPISNVPTNVPCIIAFGGEGTHSLKEANYYASLLKNWMGYCAITDVEIYSAYYYETETSYNPDAITKTPNGNTADSVAVENVKCSNRNQERANAFTNARSKILNPGATIYDVDTNYVHELYDAIIRPRIADDNGDKLHDDVALQNARNVIFFTHCHGSVTVRTFQDIMLSDMRKLGYAPAIITKIMKSILVIQHAPVSPLEKSRFNTLSFMSATDTNMDFHNKFSEYVIEHNADISPSYFELGNFFVVHNFTYDYIFEHQIVDLLPGITQNILTPDGAIIMAAERNAVINGVRAVLNGKPMPDVRHLVSPVSKSDTVRPNFDMLAKNGEFFMQIMKKDLRKSSSNNER